MQTSVMLLQPHYATIHHLKLTANIICHSIDFHAYISLIEKATPILKLGFSGKEKGLLLSRLDGASLANTKRRQFYNLTGRSGTNCTSRKDLCT